MNTEASGFGTQPIIRKLYQPGSAFALCIPKWWITRHLKPGELYVTLTDNHDGSLTIRPLQILRSDHPTPVGRNNSNCNGSGQPQPPGGRS